MKKYVLVNADFRDAYTGDIHRAGDALVMSDERITEVKAVNPDFVTVIGILDEEAVTEETVTEEPITDEPITEETVTEEPITDEPITEETVTEDEPKTAKKRTKKSED